MSKPTRRPTQRARSAALQALPVAVLQSDGKGRICLANRAALELIGTDPIGMAVSAFYASASDLPYRSPTDVMAALVSSPDNLLTNVSILMELPSGETIEALCSFRWDPVESTVTATLSESPHNLSRALSKVSESLVRGDGLDSSLSVITEEALGLTAADRAYLKLHDPKSDLLIYRALATADPGQKFRHRAAPVSQGVTGHTFQTGVPFLSGDVRADRDSPYFAGTFPDTVSKAVVPLEYVARDTAAQLRFGVLSVDGLSANQFRADVVDLLTILARHAALAIAHWVRQNELSEAHEVLLSQYRQADQILARDVVHDAKNHIRSVRNTVTKVHRLLGERKTFASLREELESKQHKLTSLQQAMTELAKLFTAESADAHRSEDVELGQLLRLATTILFTGDAAIDVALDTTGAPFLVRGHRNRLLLLFNNVLSNSVDAIRARTTTEWGQERPESSTRKDEIAVTVGPSDDRKLWQVEIRDTGVGISRQALTLIREGLSRSSHSEGVGVGMLFVRRTIEEYGGTFQIHSKVGEGTTVIVGLPARTRRVPKKRKRSSHDPKER